MAEHPHQVHKWYTKSPKEFRQDLKDIFTASLVLKAFTTGTGRGILAVLCLTILGVWIKGKPDIPIVETIFENLEAIAIGSAGIIFLFEIQDRKKRDHYEAWRVINSAHGQPGSGGRIQALQDLNNDGVGLEGVDVAGADLSGIDLRGAKLERANLSGAQLDGANLQGARLDFANLSKANLVRADLRGASLWETDFNDAYLMEAKFQDIFLYDVKLNGANLTEANLAGCVFTENTREELDLAKLCRTVLPDDIDRDPNRDCEELRIDPETGEVDIDIE